jgi:hypothetical protein
MDAPGSAWKPDADVVYRIDELGERIGVIPATCRNGEHSLHRVGYRARNSRRELPAHQLQRLRRAHPTTTRPLLGTAPHRPETTPGRDERRAIPGPPRQARYPLGPLDGAGSFIGIACDFAEDWAVALVAGLVARVDQLVQCVTHGGEIGNTAVQVRDLARGQGTGRCAGLRAPSARCSSSATSASVKPRS